MEKHLYPYVNLIIRFLSGDIVCQEFEKQYLATFKLDTHDFSQEEFDILNYLFSSCDRFCNDPGLYEEGDVTENELKFDATKALEQLKKLNNP